MAKSTTIKIIITDELHQKILAYCQEKQSNSFTHAVEMILEDHFKPELKPKA